MSYSDIRSKLRLFMGERQTIFNQGFEILAEVVSGAFGGKKSSENIVIPQTAAQAVSSFNQMFNPKP